MKTQQEIALRHQINITLAAKLSALIEQSGKFKKDIAKDLGISPALLSTWCDGNNERMPKADMLNKIADYFNVSPSYFTNEKEPISPQKQALINTINNIDNEEQLFRIQVVIDAILK